METDTDKLRKMEKRVRDSEEQYLRLVELTGDGVVVVQNGVVVETNTHFAEMCGCPVDEVIGSAFADLFASSLTGPTGSSDRSSDKGRQASQFFEGSIQRKDGGRLQVHIHLGPLSYGDRPADLMVVRNVSSQRKMEKELQKAKQLESIAALSGGIAHDYNNLLTAIIGNISLAQSYFEPGDEAFNLLHEAHEASMLAKDLTQKLITFSKGGAPATKTVAISPLLRSVTEFTLSGSNIKYKFSLPEGLWPVQVDPNQIGQAIHNLVINAKDAMPEGGLITVAGENMAVTEETSDLKAGKYVKITIEDEGIGIPEKHLEMIFDPYFSTKEMGAEKGTGLGLSICHSIIKNHGGDVLVQSQEGVGTVFSVYVPASEGEVIEEKPSIEEPVREEPILGKGRILVMDDERRIRELAGRIMDRLGYDVAFSKDGAEAIEMYQKAMEAGEPFDAVILDLTIRGGMGGKEAIKRLIDMDPHVKGIVSSGYSDDPVMADYKKYGFCGVVAKPYSIVEMSQNLSRVLTDSMPRAKKRE
ncbi:MAG: ATP-binding protein [Thermodesulfobacteriota bacterium]|nr:ATP-binding protein [Thermodesulfobacteriota bacterium]